MAYKGLSYDYRAINLLKSEQTADDYAKKNPQLKVPLLVIGEAGDKSVSQSMAIIDYLEHAHPDKPSLMPKDPCRTTQPSDPRCRSWRQSQAVCHSPAAAADSYSLCSAATVSL